MGIYYSNVWNVSGSSYLVLLYPAPNASFQSKAFPMLSTSLFSQNGSIYDQETVFGPTFTLNETALAEVGLPALTGMCRA